jgi:hypothetical protein
MPDKGGAMNENYSDGVQAVLDAAESAIKMQDATAQQMCDMGEDDVEQECCDRMNSLIDGRAEIKAALETVYHLRRFVHHKKQAAFDYSDAIRGGQSADQYYEDSVEEEEFAKGELNKAIECANKEREP